MFTEVPDLPTLIERLNTKHYHSPASLTHDIHKLARQAQDFCENNKRDQVILEGRGLPEKNRLYFSRYIKVHSD
jgi:hypothetical protein